MKVEIICHTVAHEQVRIASVPKMVTTTLNMFSLNVSIVHVKTDSRNLEETFVMPKTNNYL